MTNSTPNARNTSAMPMTLPPQRTLSEYSAAPGILDRPDAAAQSSSLRAHGGTICPSRR